MIQRIRTPEEIFRTEKKDVYALRFNQDKLAQKEQTLAEMQRWLHLNMPQSPTEVLGPSEHSNWFEGGPTMLRIDFQHEDLQAFVETWETRDGLSKDPRFQCCLLSYDEWLQEHSRYIPTLQRPSSPGVALWVETRFGVISHVVSGQNFKHHPTNYETFWMHARELWEELEANELADHHYGSVIYSPQKDEYTLLWNAALGSGSHNQFERLKKIAQWLRLPPHSKIEQEGF
jgi:hypothetical protein